MLLVALLSGFMNNTPVVVVFMPIVLAICRRKDWKASRYLMPLSYAAIAGGLAPDISLYAMTSWAILVQGIPPRVVFNDLYFSPQWMQVFAIDNSVFVWIAVLALSAATGQA